MCETENFGTTDLFGDGVDVCNGIPYDKASALLKTTGVELDFSPHFTEYNSISSLSDNTTRWPSTTMVLFGYDKFNGF